MKKKTKEKAAISWIFRTVKGQKRYLCILTLAHMALSVLSMGYPLFMKGLVNSAIAKDYDRMLHYCALLAGLVLVMFLIRCLGVFLDEFVITALDSACKRRLFRNLLHKDYTRVSGYHSGEWLTRLTSDASVVASGVVQILPGFLGTAVRLACALVLLFAYVPKLTGWVLAFGSLAVVATWILRRLVRKLHLRVQETDGRFRIFMTERLNSMMVIRAFEKEKTAMDQSEQYMKDYRVARMKRVYATGMFQNGFSLAVTCVYIAGAIYSAMNIFNGLMDYGTFTAVMQLVSQVQGPIGGISGYFTRYSTMIASAERLMEAESFHEGVTEPAVEDMPRFYQKSFESIGLRGADFTYAPIGGEEAEQRSTVLKDLNLEVRKGQYVAFCGPSGCGKSTVLKLLMCMYDLDAGQRFVRSHDGEVPLTGGWRGLFSYVPQGNQLMSGTIREVVTFGDEALLNQDEKIWQALKVACADFMEDLPDGLDTQLGERGAGLSEGQMQRIAIARAVFSDRPILLLDEATSALDEDTELRLLDNLKAMTDKTVIIVTHRPAALAITDQIIQFEPPQE